MRELLGQKLGQYEIVAKIGEGGMASVFKAYQPTLDRFVAIKVMSLSLAKELGFAKRFQNEAQAIARLDNHDNILAVYDFGVEREYNYLVMRYVENSLTLQDLMKSKAPIERLIDYVLQIADALNYTHSRGVIHRDIKPSNILIDGDKALLSDFGLAKITQGTIPLDKTSIMGTPAYMSPEQISGHTIDHRTDIYALGIILYQILTDTIPHCGDLKHSGDIALLFKRVHEPARPLHEISPTISPDMDKVVLHSLATEPADRFNSAGDFAEAVQKVRQDSLLATEAMDGMKTNISLKLLLGDGLSTAPALPKSANSSWIKLGAIILIIIALVGVLGYFGFSGNNLPTPTATVIAVVLPTLIATNTVIPTLTPSPTLARIPIVLVNTRLEVRAGPGTQYDLLGKLLAKSSAEITGQDESQTWWQIRFSGSNSGFGWIPITSVEMISNSNVPIVLAPSTPTVPATPTPSAIPATVTPTQATATLVLTTTPTPQVIVTKLPMPTSTPVQPSTLAINPPVTLLEPLIEANIQAGSATTFKWQWPGQLSSNMGFEILIWQEGVDTYHGGGYSAVDTTQAMSQKNDHYQFSFDPAIAASVIQHGSGEYRWSVSVVTLEPYSRVGVEATPRQIIIVLPGSSGGGNNNGGGGNNNGNNGGGGNGGNGGGGG